MAFCLLAALAAYPAAATERQPYLVLGVGGLAVLALATGLVLRQRVAVAYAIALFGGEYAVFLRLAGDSVDVRAPFVAAALVVTAELAFAAVAPEGGRLERPLVVDEAAALVSTGVATALVAGFLLLASGSAASGVALEAVGALAAVGTLAALVRAARSSRR